MQNLRKEARFPYAGTKNLLLFLWSALVYLSMKYRVNGIEIPLDRKETAAAKRMVAKFMEEVEKNSKDTGNTSLYDVQIIVDNSVDEFKAGMSAEVKLSIEKEELTVTIPKKAIFEDGGKKYVYSVNSDNKTVKTEVTTGILTEKSAEIKSGVNKDDTVVIGGLNLISDGTLVFPVTKED